MQMSSSVEGAPGPGRPRDPDMEERVFDGVLAVFGESGWRGFSIEAVAREVGVGKTTIYRRWPNKTDLLVATVRTRIGPVSDVETGDVRSELLALVRKLMRNYSAGRGSALMRLSMEARLVPELKVHWEDVASSQILAARAIVRRAIDRGELPSDTSVTLLLDTLSGAVIVHAQVVPKRLRGRQAQQAEQYAEQLVDFVLTAVVHGGSTASNAVE